MATKSGNANRKNIDAARKKQPRYEGIFSAETEGSCQTWYGGIYGRPVHFRLLK
jgi:hypothetical protein